MIPTRKERAFLLRCAEKWDRVAALWDGPRTLNTGRGLCWTALTLSFADEGAGRVMGMVGQCLTSRPPDVGRLQWWPPGGARDKRAAHAHKLAARCRVLAGEAS